MTLYRKKPVVISAVQFAGIVDTGFMGLHGPAFKGKIPPWLQHNQVPEGEPIEIGFWSYDTNRLGGVMLIGTLEGIMTAMPNDYIIQGVNGEIYSCKPDIFELTYEEVKENE